MSLPGPHSIPPGPDFPGDVTINRLVDRSCRRFASRPALGMAAGARLTYEELRRRVRRLAGYLTRQAGIEPGDTVAIVAENSVDWGVCYLAIVLAGGVAVPVLPDFPDADVRHVMRDAGVRLAFVSPRQEEKLTEMTRPPALVRIGPTARRHAGSGPPCLEEVLGRDVNGRLEFPPVDRDDLASIIYTSGTSGHSKAVMLSHGNLCSNVLAASSLIGIDEEKGWVFLSILPISHAYEFTIGFLLPLLHGALVVYAGKTPTPAVLQRLCAKERPMVVCVVPMILEKIHKKRVKAAIEANGLLRLACRLPFIERRVLRRAGTKIMSFFGGRLRALAIGGAALSTETEAFLRHAGLPYIVGYGLTETSPLVAAGPFGDPDIALGSCGKPVPGVEVRIGSPGADGLGEIMVRGPNVMKGYLGNPELTAMVIDGEGWFATGDVGYIDAKGNLHVRGRSKNVIVLSHGENIYPEVIEERLNGLPQVAESVVVARDGRLVALVYPDYDVVGEETAGMARPARAAYMNEMLGRVKKEINERLPVYSRLHAVIEHQEPFAKTATQKIKRYLYER